METINVIKVRNSDGTYSDEMPIGTTSNYVTVVADGSTLSDVLGKVNVASKKSLQDQLEILQAENKILKKQIEDLIGRISILEDNIL
jgi:hypothetical protein